VHVVFAALTEQVCVAGHLFLAFVSTPQVRDLETVAVLARVLLE
jgi:hypothetical protein